RLDGGEKGSAHRRGQGVDGRMVDQEGGDAALDRQGRELVHDLPCGSEKRRGQAAVRRRRWISSVARAVMVFLSSLPVGVTAMASTSTRCSGHFLRETPLAAMWSSR